MTYKELQTALKAIKLRGLSDIKLNSSKEELQKEYDRTKDLKTLREAMSERVAAGEVLYPVTEETKETNEVSNKDLFELAVDSYIEIIEKTLSVKFHCDYKIDKSMILENKEMTVKKILAKIAKDADVNKIDFLLEVEENIENDFIFCLTNYRYDSLNYFLENFGIYISKTESLQENTQEQKNEIIENVGSEIEITESLIDALVDDSLIKPIKLLFGYVNNYSIFELEKAAKKVKNALTLAYETIEYLDCEQIEMLNHHYLIYIYKQSLSHYCEETNRLKVA